MALPYAPRARLLTIRRAFFSCVHTKTESGAMCCDTSREMGAQCNRSLMPGEMHFWGVKQF